MIFIICFIYWIISAIVGLSFVSEKDSPEVGVMVGFISVFFGMVNTSNSMPVSNF